MRRLTFVIAAILLAGCYARPTPIPANAIVPTPIHWAYEGEEGPEHWSDLSPDFTLCKTGKAQTPIDISGAAITNAPDVQFDYKTAELRTVNNGHTLMVNAGHSQSAITVDETRYELVQYHFHTPSEHTFDGKSLPMEMHLVHQNEAGILAVVGVMIEVGVENTAYAPIGSHLPADRLIEIDTGVSINPADLLPKDTLAYEYVGSLTTPPCSENVQWYILKTPVQLSASQIDAFSRYMGKNNRPIQPLNERSLVEDSGSD